MSILKSFLFFLCAAAAAAIPVFLLWVDIHVFADDVPEISLTEIVQETLLGCIVVMHFWLAKKYDTQRYCNILIGGFFLAMLIRELDSFFDLFFHGSWVWFALFTSFLSLCRPLRHWNKTLAQLTHYTRTPYYGIMMSGLLCVLVFSRLFGMQFIWHAVLNDGYIRVLKNAIEECSESFGYVLCFMASAGSYCHFRAMARQPAPVTRSHPQPGNITTPASASSAG
ncbi:transporter [Shimwellia pseudoproteus]|uniref:transporter n=1 Tax=Shimwellia pseudoproteus TaxID=570012 RepID=UPI001E481BEB|nr:transporter [Shimwellia pseudoproteus]